MDISRSGQNRACFVPVDSEHRERHRQGTAGIAAEGILRASERIRVIITTFCSGHIMSYGGYVREIHCLGRMVRNSRFVIPKIIRTPVIKSAIIALSVRIIDARSIGSYRWAR